MRLLIVMQSLWFGFGDQVTHYSTQWDVIHRRLQHDSDFMHYVELYGTAKAEKVFREHILRLKKDFTRQRQAQHLHRLSAVLRDILPDLATIADR